MFPVVLGLVGLTGSQSYAQGRTHLGVPPSDFVILQTFLDPEESKQMSRVLLDGTIEPFTLPAQTLLVITDLSVKINGLPVPGIVFAGICFPGCETHLPSASFHTDMQTIQHVNLTGGVLLNYEPVAIASSSSPQQVTVTAYGYLVKAGMVNGN
jgi:hypothetical protein